MPLNDQTCSGIRWDYFASANTAHAWSSGGVAFTARRVTCNGAGERKHYALVLVQMRRPSVDGYAVSFDDIFW